MPGPHPVRLAGALLIACPALAAAQSEASLGLGAGTVRFPGGSSVSVVSLGPELQFVGPVGNLQAGGTVAALPSGNAYLQGRLSAWAATSPLAGRWRLAVDGALTGATSGPGTASGAGQVSVEALRAGSRWGAAVGAGPASGWIAGEFPVTAWRARLRLWWQNLPGRLHLFAKVEPTWFLDAWFTDVEAGVGLGRGRFETTLSGSARLSDAYGSKAAGLATAELRLTPEVSLEAGGGNVLPDPYQGLPASGFATVGIRIHLPLGTGTPKTLIGGRAFTAVRRGAAIVIRLRDHEAHAVAIAGDWTGWTPTAPSRVARGSWEWSVLLSPGPHQFVVFIDGEAWQIPDGVPSVADGMGGRVAVLTVF